MPPCVVAWQHSKSETSDAEKRRARIEARRRKVQNRGGFRLSQHLNSFGGYFVSDIRSSCKAKGRGVIFSAPSKVR